MFSLKKNNMLGPGPAFTVRLEVDYKKPIPAGSNIICSAKVDSVEGRKVSCGRAVCRECCAVSRTGE